MRSIFEQPEPDILMQYYDQGEGFWAKVKRCLQNVFRCAKGDELLDYDERDEFDYLEEWSWFNDKW